MRLPRLTPSLLFLIFANLLPIVGVFVLGWDVVTILVLYWLESVIIGLLNIPKILVCKDGPLSKLFTTAFFIVHYGGFTAGHGAILKELFGADISVERILGGSLFWIALSFLLSHTISMFINFFGKKEYVGRTSNEQMFSPYGRVFVMHLVVLLGGFLMEKFGAPMLALLMLILLKTIIDIAAHRKSHAGGASAQV